METNLRGELTMAYDLDGMFKRIQHQMHLTPSVQLDELSTCLRVGRHTIEKAIKNATGKTFREHRSTKLLEHATQLLDGGAGQSIKQIAFRLGYSSQRSFSRFIKASAGCSPKELRNRQKSRVAAG